MPKRPRSRRVLALLLALLAGGWACGRPLSRAAMPRQTALTPGVTIFGTLPQGPEDRELLGALPVIARYRWAAPSAHFRNVTPEEDSAAMSFEAHALRRDVVEVLRINGWREAAADDVPEFELAVMRIERSAEYRERRPDPRGQMPDPNSCRNRPTSQRTNCVEPLPRDYPPIIVTTRGTDVRFAFAIVRLADRATAWWISPVPSELQIATLRLLQAGAESPPAVSP